MIRLRYARLDRRMTQQRLAAEAACDVSDISLVERGLRLPTEEKLLRICAVLGVAREDAMLPFPDASRADPAVLSGVYPPQRRSAAGGHTLLGLGAARRRLGWSQHQLGLKLGVRQTHMSQIENGKRPITQELLDKMRDVLGVEERVLLCAPGAPPAYEGMPPLPGERKIGD